MHQRDVARGNWNDVLGRDTSFFWYARTSECQELVSRVASMRLSVKKLETMLLDVKAGFFGTASARREHNSRGDDFGEEEDLVDLKRTSTNWRRPSSEETKVCAGRHVNLRTHPQQRRISRTATGRRRRLSEGFCQKEPQDNCRGTALAVCMSLDVQTSVRRLVSSPRGCTNRPTSIGTG